MIQDIIVYCIILVAAVKVFYSIANLFISKKGKEVAVCKGCTSCSPIKIIPSK